MSHQIFENEQVPAETEQVPAVETEQVPVENEQVPAETEQVPMELQKIYESDYDSGEASSTKSFTEKRKREERELEVQSGPSVIKRKKLSSEKRKREEENYELNEQLHEDFDWKEMKKVKLDSLDDRKAALNERQSFTMLVSSASLILPPEVNSILISRNNYLVEWNQESADNPIPPTKVTQ